MSSPYKRLISNTSVYFIGNIAQNIAAFLLLPLYTHYLSLADFGAIALIALTGSLFTKAATSPITIALQRFLFMPEYRDRSGSLAFSLFVVLIAKCIVFSTLFYMATGALNQLLFDDDQYLTVLKLYSVLIILAPVSYYLLFLIRMYEMARFFVGMSLVGLVTLCGVNLWCLVVLDTGVISLVYSEIASSTIIATICMIRILPKLTLKFSFATIRESLQFAYPQITSGYSTLMIESGDRYLLRIFDSVASVGSYTFGYRIASALNVGFAIPLRNSLMPIIYKLEDDPVRQREFLVRCATFYYLVSVFLALGLSIFAQEFVRLISISNPSFWGSWIIVPIIAYSYVLNGLSQFLNFGVVMARKSYHITMNLLICAVSNLVLNLVMIPLWGIVGAAVATLISYGIWSYLKAHYSQRFYALEFDWHRIRIATLIGVALYSVSWIVQLSLLPTILIKIFILSLYFPCTYWIGFYRVEELAYLKNTLRTGIEWFRPRQQR